MTVPNLHHGMSKRELARHISDPYAAGHAGRYVATPNTAQWYIGEIEHTHAEYHGAQHLKDEMHKAIAMLGLPRACERCGDDRDLYAGGVCPSCLAYDAGATFAEVR